MYFVAVRGSSLIAPQQERTEGEANQQWRAVHVVQRGHLRSIMTVIDFRRSRNE